MSTDLPLFLSHLRGIIVPVRDTSYTATTALCHGRKVVFAIPGSCFPETLFSSLAGSKQRLWICPALLGVNSLPSQRVSSLLPAELLFSKALAVSGFPGPHLCCRLGGALALADLRYNSLSLLSLYFSN